MEKILGVIPARGGSEGVPGKNIKLLSGRPMIEYTIEAAKNSSYLGRVIVSTDDREIAKVAREKEAEVIIRPEELATDEAPTEPVLKHVIEQLERDENYLPELIVLLQPTSPLRGASIIDQCIKKLLVEELDSVLTVCEDRHFYWQSKDSQVEALYDYRLRPRRQDKEPRYRENGAVYVTKKDILTNENNRLGGRIGLVVMDEMDSLEIDTSFDFWLAERIMEYRKGIDEDD